MATKQDWRKRQALQIVSQLPDDTNDALTVLNHARDFVLWCREGEEDAPPSAVVTAFPASASSR